MKESRKMVNEPAIRNIDESPCHDTLELPKEALVTQGRYRPLAVEAVPSHGDIAVCEEMGLDDGLEMDFAGVAHVCVLFFPGPEAFIANVPGQKTTAV